MSITSFRTTYMSNRTEDVANKGKIADLVVKFMDFDMNINPPRFRVRASLYVFTISMKKTMKGNHCTEGEIKDILFRLT